MAKLFFILTCGADDPTKATRCFQFAKIAADQGNLKGIMLVDDAVYLSNSQISDNIVAPTGDKLSDHLSNVLKSGVEILCCKPCCATRNISKEDLPPGFVLGTGVTAMEISAIDGVNTLVF